MSDRPLFRGELVELRPIERANVDTYLRWMRDPEVTRGLTHHAVPMTVERQQEWYDEAARRTDEWILAVHDAIDGRLIGNCGLHRIEQRNRAAELGILIGEKEYWDRGYGTDAVRVLCRLGFTELNLHRIELDVFAFNERGIRAYEKAGFTIEGRRREAMFREGRYHDRLVMAILAHEWKSR